MSSTATAPRSFAARLRSGPVLDVTIAAATFAWSMVLLSHHRGFSPSRLGSKDLDLLGVVLAASSTLPLIVWRRSPLGVFGLTATAGVLLAGFDYRIEWLLGPAVAVYLLAVSRSGDEPWTRRSTVTVFVLFLAYLTASAGAQRAFPGPELLHTGLAWAVAWFAGERTRLRQEHIAELKERALRAERDAERERQLAVAEERARIARDLHDSAGHAISVIAVRAGAARLRHQGDLDRTLHALEAIEELARGTAEEIDQIVGTLREGGAADTVVKAPPGIGSLDTLIAHYRSAGLDVTVDAKGPARPLSSTSDQAIYRILQEALTNAARYGSGSARIALAFGDETIELTVTNPVLADGEPRSSGGHGLIGMHERATLLGGSFDAARVNGAFRIRARIPYLGHRV
jgi:signal transduction histidine kinase